MKPQDAKWCQTAVFAFSSFKFVCHVSKAKVERTESLCPKGLPESVLEKLKKKDVCTLERILLVISIWMQCEHSRIRLKSRYWPEAQQVLQMRDGLHQASLKERHGDLSSMLTHWVPKKQEESQAAQAECCSSCSAFQREFHKATIGWINAKFGLERS